MLGSSKLKNLGFGTLASIAFYAITGAPFLVLLPLSNYPPHIGLTGLMSLITAYSILTKRPWAKWLVAGMFFVATTISLYTVYFIIMNNLPVALLLIAYAVLIWYFTYYAFIKKI
jgi:hypothetical protein